MNSEQETKSLESSAWHIRTSDFVQFKGHYPTLRRVILRAALLKFAQMRHDKLDEPASEAL